MDGSTPVAERFPTEPQSFPSDGVNSLAPIPSRWLARVVDTALVALPVLVVTTIVVVAQTSGDPSADPADAAAFDTRAETIQFGAIAALATVYEAVAVTLWGQTLGKLLVGIRVARQVNGRCPLWWESLLRIALPGVVLTVPHPLAKAAAMALYAVAMFDPLRRGVPDRAAGTVVVRAR